MESPSHADRITTFLTGLLAGARLELDFHVRMGERDAAAPEPAASSPMPLVLVDFTGGDSPMLLARNGELLHALEHLTAQLLRLEPQENHLLVFDASGFKQQREDQLRQMVDRAVAEVRRSGRPFSFPPMSSRERRLLHLALSGSGLTASSSGEPPRRFVVLYPAPGSSPEPQPQTVKAPANSRREQEIRERFRRR